MPATRAELTPRGICLQIWGYYCIHPFLSFSNSLSLLCCRVWNHCRGVVYHCVPDYCSSFLWYCLSILSWLLCLYFATDCGRMTHVLTLLHSKPTSWVKQGDQDTAVKVDLRTAWLKTIKTQHLKANQSYLRQQMKSQFRLKLLETLRLKMYYSL